VFVLMGLVFVLGFGPMLVCVAVPGEAPDQKAKAGDHQDAADDVALLRLDQFLELQAD
jgi:hypothetical protein